jgi:Rrf2 family protein
MKFSTRAGYGLRAMVNLAKNHPKQKSLQEISKEEGISLKYMEKLFGVLRKNNLVKSQKGREGGYILFCSPQKTPVSKIIESLEGPIIPMQCAEGKCNSKCACSSSIVWIKLQKQIKKTLNQIKLSDLI